MLATGIALEIVSPGQVVMFVMDTLLESLWVCTQLAVA